MPKQTAFAEIGECRRKGREIPVTAHCSDGVLIHIDCGHADCPYVSRCKIFDKLQQRAFTESE